LPALTDWTQAPLGIVVAVQGYSVARARARSVTSVRSGIGTVVYLIVGVIIASTHHYLTHVSALKPIVSALLAIILWPLLLLGINLHIR
jgi:hypothetical protein